MENEERKAHWEHIYQTKKTNDVSWYQAVPNTSLHFIDEFNVPKTAKIIDIGGGDSLLVDHLLAKGYNDITVLDISATSIERAKARLGSLATKVKWVAEDVTQFKPTEQYDYWHDRAAFHFLTMESEINSYIDCARKHITPGGYLVIGTFSEQGPKKCSGIEIKQYSENSLVDRFKQYFQKVKCIQADHHTPFNTVQNFIFCSFKRF